MSEWKESDEVTTTAGSLWLSQQQAYLGGLNGCRQAIQALKANAGDVADDYDCGFRDALDTLLLKISNMEALAKERSND